MRIALYQPDIAPNAGTIARTCAALGIGLDVIEPCGFPFDGKAFRRAAMDYAAALDLRRFPHVAAFAKTAADEAARIVLVETDGNTPYERFAFSPYDVLVLGRESAGAGPEVRAVAAASVRIRLVAGARSLNVAVAAAMVLGEALRQTGGGPPRP